eukprot:3639346-Prorocentrum_lima.AAC.1
MGSLHWVAQKTRPAVARLVEMAASVQPRNPEEALRLLKGCWTLLCETKTPGMMPRAEETSID